MLLKRDHETWTVGNHISCQVKPSPKSLIFYASYIGPNFVRKLLQNTTTVARSSLFVALSSYRVALARSTHYGLRAGHYGLLL